MSAKMPLARWAPLMATALMTLLACGSSASSAELPGDRVRRLEAGDSLPNLTRPAGFAGTLSDADIEDLAEYFSSLPQGKLTDLHGKVGGD